MSSKTLCSTTKRAERCPSDAQDGALATVDICLFSHAWFSHLALIIATASHKANTRASLNDPHTRTRVQQSTYATTRRDREAKKEEPDS